MEKKSLARCSLHTTATISKIKFRSEARTGNILHMAYNFFLANVVVKFEISTTSLFN